MSEIEPFGIFRMGLLDFDEAGQESGDPWKEHDDYGHNDECIQKWEDSFKNRVERYVGSYTLDHKDIDPDGGCNHPHLSNQDDDDPEPDRVEPERLDHRVEYGDGEHDKGHGIHKESAYKIDKDDNADNRHSGNGKAPHPIGQDKGDARYG